MRVVTMKSTLTHLTLLAVAVFAVHDRSLAQENEPGPEIAESAAASHSDVGSLETPRVGTAVTDTYSAHVGDEEPVSTFVGDDSSDVPQPVVPQYQGDLGGADFASFAAGGSKSCGKGCGGVCGGKGCYSTSKCGSGCDCPLCRHRAFTSRVFVGFEYLNWWDKSRGVPPLVTTDASTTPINAGPPNFEPIALTNPAAGISQDARVLFGGGNIGGELQTGARLTGGLWLDDDRSRAIGIKAYGNEGYSLKQNISSDGTQPLGISFFNTDPVNVGFGEDAFILAHDNFGLNRNGSVDITAQNDFVGGELFYRSLLDAGCNYRLDALFGYQYARIDDDMVLRARVNDVNTGDIFTFNDLFETTNSYNAGSLGAQAELYRSRFTLSMLGKISLGNMRQKVTIAGSNTANALETNGGFFAQPFTNIGTHTRDVTVWSPEANFKLAYALTHDLSFSIGYTFIYWNKMVLAGDQIDRNVNATQLSGGNLNGPGDPTFTFRDTDYWVQTLDIGVNWRF